MSDPATVKSVPDYDQGLIEVLEASPIGAVILDRHDQVLFWNSPLLEILGGMQGDEFAVAASSAFFRNRAEFDVAKGRLSTERSVTGIETQVRRADHREVWVSVNLRTIVFESQPATLVWYFDVTENRRARNALERSQQTLLTVLDAAPFAVALTDGPGLVSYWNNALLELLAQPKEGEPALDLHNVIELALDTIDHVGENQPFTLPDGRWVTAWKRRIEFEGRPADLLWLHGITDLMTAREEAENASRARSAFLATMSHEIRTPMNGVRTMAELLLDTRLSADQAKMVNTICDSTDALISVINDILDFSKIEAGKLDIAPQPFAIERLLDGVVDLLQSRAAEKGLALRLDMARLPHRWLFGDDLRLRQILLNLVGNAIKFTERGRIDVTVAPDGDGVRFDVRDTGIGITPEKLAELFTPFRQADATTARKFGGSGLGLSICKGLIDLMGGRIGAESEHGAGSCFWFSLPLPAAEPPAAGAETSHRQRSVGRWTAPARDVAEANAAVVLCAEDNATNRDVLGRVLDRLGIAFDMAENGVLALGKLDRARHGLLLTDGHMPEMDGWELASRVRADEAAAELPRLPILALTADAIRGVDEKCFAAGMDGYLTKPLSVAQVERELVRLLPALDRLRTADDGRSGGSATVFAIEESVLDLSDLMDIVDGDRDAVSGMVGRFLQSAAELVHAVGDALAASDAPAVRAQAHSLRGAARYVGAIKLAEAAGQVEAAAADGNLPEARRWSPALGPLLEEVAQAVEKMKVEDQLLRIQDEISELAAQGRDLRAGLGLETVVGITENAADRILAASESILGTIDSIGSHAEAEAIQSAVMAILEACSFQDLTSQRVRKAIARLSEIEDRLEAVVQRRDSGGEAETQGGGSDLVDQADIDRLFG